MRHLLDDLRDGISLDEMVNKTCARFEVSAQVAERDLLDMISRLIEEGIIEPAA